jgi:hypothetical protein
MKTLRTIAFLSLLVVMGSCKDENVAITGICPVVLSTTPPNLASGVDLGTTIVITFNESMNPLTITPETFTLTAETNTVGVAAVIAGVLTYDAPTNSMRFDPTNPLPVNSVFTGRVEPWVKDLMGNALQEPYIWTFTTGVQPVVILVSPLDLAVNVPVNTDVTATFNIPMTSATLVAANITVMNGAVPVVGIVTYTAPTVTFNPNSDLLPGVTYSVMLTSAIRSALGVPLMTPYVWTFTTLAPVAPTVVSTDPADLQTGVALNSDVSVLFSQTMDAATLTTSSFTLKLGAVTVPGTVNTVGATSTFNPTGNLLSGETYTATITTSAENSQGVALANEFVWTFNTAAPLGPNPVILNSVAAYGIIAGVGVRNDAGFSVIHDMNVGISPGVRSSITGFPPATVVNGAIHASDDLVPTGIAAVLLAAKQHLVEAYLFAEGATFPAPQTADVDQGGLTLAPGIYKASTSLLIQNGDLTLDAQGDANAVWIFQIGSALTTVGGAGGNIILAGGAQAKNIYWQVGSSATIGDNTIFKGNVLALSDITMNSGAVAEGRMLARNGTVVMTSTNTITKP